MKNYLIRNREQYLTILGFIIILCSYFYYKMDYKILLGLLGTVATLYFGSMKQRIENDKLFKELFQEFNARYDEDFNDLINELRYENDRELKVEETNLIIDYLNLCSEEYLWWTRNRIPGKVWNAWKSGINENLKIGQVKKIYDNEISTSNGKNSFYGLVEELKN